MRAALWAVLLVATLLIVTDAQAGCSVCFPECTSVIASVSGRVNCISSSSYCRIWGDMCSGGGGCDCGTMGCNPCNATCAPAAVPSPEWQLVQVNVDSPRVTQPAAPSAPQWTLVAVTTKREQS